jgi:hypothetical protein
MFKKQHDVQASHFHLTSLQSLARYDVTVFLYWQNIFLAFFAKKNK